ncbi:adenylate kinase [Pseudomonas frederiksbergensis]|uniref:Adenylate kinase n=1 Tax=Pseudomonas frederiksbergensis TaxID=104087 RepID=A0A423K4W6_9PSED|nr:adenylate kinase [Pseudomonas frederiksbergensis]RON46571.1 adenylate kinase [Pseudomonas frederiksbergensis]
MNMTQSLGMNFARTLIIGNSGAGKSWLAERLAKRQHVPWIDLDRVHWICDEHSIARPRNEALAIARVAASEEYWVIEGVYGWIISELLPQATTLIWLSPDDGDCVAQIRQREARRDADDKWLIELLEWAGSYRSRAGSSGFKVHQRLFQGFSGSKLQLTNRAEITTFINALPPR